MRGASADLGLRVDGGSGSGGGQECRGRQPARPGPDDRDVWGGGQCCGFRALRAGYVEEVCPATVLRPRGVHLSAPRISGRCPHPWFGVGVLLDSALVDGWRGRYAGGAIGVPVGLRVRRAEKGSAVKIRRGRAAVTGLVRSMLQMVHQPGG